MRCHADAHAHAQCANNVQSRWPTEHELTAIEEPPLQQNFGGILKIK